MLTWYRSWPRVVPEGRAYVVDALPRLVMEHHDYAGVIPEAEPGVCILEWDVALDRTGRLRFELDALAKPDEVLVAPYPIYPVGGVPTTVHKVAFDRRHMGIRTPIPVGLDHTHSFGFGCIYMPASVLRQWNLERKGRVMRDNTFSDWHIERHGTARVTWDVHPQHLHGD